MIEITDRDLLRFIAAVAGAGFVAVLRLNRLLGRLMERTRNHGRRIEALEIIREKGGL